MSCVMVMITLDYIIIVAVELVSKNSYRTYVSISYVMVTMTLDYIIIVAVELALKNGYRTYPYHVLW